MIRRPQLYALVLAVLCLSYAQAAQPTQKAVAFCRAGQTFITWKDADTKENVTYSVWRSDAPITDLSAERIADGIQPGSGTDFIAARIAPREKRTEAPKGFVIRPNGLPLPVGSGLYVHTVTKPGVSYYAVEGLKAGDPVPVFFASTGPVKEKPGTPEPYLEKVAITSSGKFAKTYIHWSDTNISYKEGLPFKFVVTIGKDVKKDKPAPMVLAIHAYSGYATASEGWGHDFVVLSPDDYTKGLPFDGYDWWYGYNSNLGGDLTKGVNVNYTERRLIYSMDFVKRMWKIDENRIYLRGSSMGGTGSVAFGLRHPEIFAAIFANVPQVNPAMDNIGWSQQNIEKYCGTREQAIKTNEGTNVWDRMNMTKYVTDNHGDFPFLRTINARDDQVLKWPQIPGFLKAMNDNRHGFISGWGLGMHNISSSQVPVVVKDFDIFKMRKDVSFPAFSNSTLNDNPGTGDPKDGTTTGQMGGGFDWTIVEDKLSGWEATVKVLVEGKSDATTDITPRRLQKFKPKPGERFQWENKDSIGNILQSGLVTADQWSLVTISQVKLSAAGNTVRIYR